VKEKRENFLENIEKTLKEKSKIIAEMKHFLEKFFLLRKHILGFSQSRKSSLAIFSITSQWFPDFEGLHNPARSPLGRPVGFRGTGISISGPPCQKPEKEFHSSGQRNERLRAIPNFFRELFLLYGEGMSTFFDQS
jgi:hypothetical protein